VGKGDRCVELTTLSPSCANCFEIWELQPPGTLRTCPGLYRSSLPSLLYLLLYLSGPDDGLIQSETCSHEKILILILIYLLTAIGLTPGGSSTAHIYTQTIHRTTHLTTLVGGFLEFEPRGVKLKLTMN